MAIYNIFDYYDRENSAKSFLRSQAAIDPALLGATQSAPVQQEDKGSLFSALAARLFFFILLVADLCWMGWSFCMVCIKSLLVFLSLGKLFSFKHSLSKSFLSLKRSLVSAVALLVALFSPALGIMFSCMYFLMYDRQGVDEIVPNSLRDQFKEIFPL